MKLVIDTRLSFDNWSIGKEFFEHYKIPYTVFTSYYNDKEYIYYRANSINVSRFDMRLIEFIEKFYNGQWENLKVVEIPDGNKYFIYGTLGEKIIMEDDMQTASAEMSVWPD